MSQEDKQSQEVPKQPVEEVTTSEQKEVKVEDSNVLVSKIKYSEADSETAEAIVTDIKKIQDAKLKYYAKILEVAMNKPELQLEVKQELIEATPLIAEFND